MDIRERERYIYIYHISFMLVPIGIEYGDLINGTKCYVYIYIHLVFQMRCLTWYLFKKQCLTGGIFLKSDV